MCSVVTNLVTSLEFQPIRCATTLFHFGRTRHGYVATRFILLITTAGSSTKSGYVVAPERSGQSEAWAGRNVARARKKPSFVPSSGFNRCCMLPHVIMNLFSIHINFILCILNFFFNAFFNFLLWKLSFIFCLCCYLLCRRGNNHFDVHFRRIGPVFFQSQMEKTRSVKEELDGRVFFSRKSRHFFLCK